MVVNSPTPRPLTSKETESVLPFPAVIVLRDGDEVVALVETANANSTVAKILRGDAGSGVRATTFQVRNADESVALYKELLDEFVEEHCRAPRHQHLF